MKKLSTHFLVAVVTFLLGIALTLFWFYKNHHPTKQNIQQPSIEKNTAQTNSVSPNQAINLMDVFYDFALVNKGKCNDAEIFNHGVQTLPMPNEFEAGYCYIFHRHTDTINDYLFKDLQNRLRAKTIRILKANGYMHRNVGGLIFGIEFQSEKYIGTIRNQTDRKIITDKKLSKEWFVDDYILEITESNTSN